MPKEVHELAEKLKGKKGVDNPFALANSIIAKKGGNAYPTKKGRKHGKSKKRPARRY